MTGRRCLFVVVCALAAGINQPPGLAIAALVVAIVALGWLGIEWSK